MAIYPLHLSLTLHIMCDDDIISHAYESYATAVGDFVFNLLMVSLLSIVDMHLYFYHSHCEICKVVFLCFVCHPSSIHPFISLHVITVSPRFWWHQDPTCNVGTPNHHLMQNPYFTCMQFNFAMDFMSPCLMGLD